MSDDAILKELKHIKLLLAQGFLGNQETKNDKIIFLNKFGFEVNEIADILSTTNGTVSVALSRAKSKKKSPKKTAKKVKQDGDN